MKYYLIAGEPSGDALGGKLMDAIRRKDKDAEFFGLGGDSMQSRGFNSLFNISDLAIMGLAEVIPSIPKVLRRIKETVQNICDINPDVVVTIDSWSFSARVHKALRKTNKKIPQIHYVAPQVWAWKKKRAKTMYKYIDHLLTLFPQEPKYFIPHNLPTTFVGHPVIESDVINGEKGDFRKQHNIPKNNKIMLVLPGSRHNEVERLLPTFLDVVRNTMEKYEDFTFVIPTVSTVSSHVKSMVEKSKLPIVVIEGTKARHDAFKNADIAIAASGTVALELAIVNVPHIVAYKVPKLTEYLVKRFIHIQFVNLSNILLGREIVPELLQEDCNVEKISYYIDDFINKKSTYDKQMVGFEKVRELLGMGKQTPSDNACDKILEIITK
jgi:lipid-A-disaccharide synthase